MRVNTITPGFFPAEQNKRLLFNADGSPTDRAKQILGHTPMGRFGDADELIGATVFLAAQKASSFVTGSDIRVDGGFLSQTIRVFGVYSLRINGPVPIARFFRSPSASTSSCG